jgi:hypothetical protein
VEGSGTSGVEPSDSAVSQPTKTQSLTSSQYGVCT